MVSLILRRFKHGIGLRRASLIMYGQVFDTTSLKRVTAGVLTWTITPVSGGVPVTVSAALTNIDGQFSYRLRGEGHGVGYDPVAAAVG
jgi:hypothetical protein